MVRPEKWQAEILTKDEGQFPLSTVCTFAEDVAEAVLVLDLGKQSFGKMEPENDSKRLFSNSVIGCFDDGLTKMALRSDICYFPIEDCY